MTEAPTDITEVEETESTETASTASATTSTTPTDRHTAMIEFLSNCPEIANHDIFFNFSESDVGDTVIATSANEHTVEQYINGFALKWYDFAIIQYKTASTDPNVTTNTSAIVDMEKIISWVNSQEDAENYPDFGNGCEIQSIEALQSTPTVAGQNQTSAKYMISCRVEFLERI